MSRFSRSKRLLTAAVITSLCLLVNKPRAALFDHEVSARPPLSFTEQVLPTAPLQSSVGASAVISYQALTAALTSAFPKTFDASGRQQVCADLTEAVQQTIQKSIGGDVGHFLGRVTRFITQVVTVNQLRHVCQDVDYSVQVDRTSPVMISAGTNKLHVAMNVSISGRAGFSGDLAKAVALNSKNFRGGLAAFADIAMDVDENWCPKLQINAGYQWTDKAQLEIVHNVWLGIEGQVGDRLTDQIRKSVEKVQSSLTCVQIANAAKSIWHPYTFPLNIEEVGTLAYGTFLPSSLGFSGISYTVSNLAFALSISGTTQITTAKPIDPPASELPKLKRIPAFSDKISIALPIKVGYEAAGTALQTVLRGKTFEADTPVGHTKVNIDGVKLYPSDGKLAFAIHFSASNSHRIFNTQGTVYLVGIPTLDANRQVVSVKQVSFTAVLDNPLWSSVAAVFSGPIKSFIEDRATYNLAPKIAELQSKMQSELAKVATQQKLLITLSSSFAGLRDIQLGRDVLEVVASFDGQADLIVHDINLPDIN